LLTEFGVFFELFLTAVRISSIGECKSLFANNVTKFQDNQIIHGKCGGYCGTCIPEPHHGLKLDLLPT
jgi:hypothetical protein